MCPGGEVVAAASEPGGVVTNGASLSARNGRNANAALLVNIEPDDLPGDNPLAGMHLQRSCEQRAFELGGGAYRAPAQTVGDVLSRQPRTGHRRIEPTYPRGVTWGSLEASCRRTSPKRYARAFRCLGASSRATMIQTPSSPHPKRAQAHPSRLSAIVRTASPSALPVSIPAARVRATRVAS